MTTDQDRAAFEAAYAKEFPHATKSYFWRDEKGNYFLTEVNHAWLFWQVATAAERERRKPMTEEDIVKCLVDTRCIGGVRMTYDSGPYELTTPTMIAVNMVRAVEAHHGIGLDDHPGA